MKDFLAHLDQPILGRLSIAMPISYEEFRRLPTLEEEKRKVGEQVEKVSKFIEELKEPSNLLAGCRKFVEGEPRDYLYILCSYFSASSNSRGKVFAVDKLLREWNISYYRYRPSLKQRICNDLDNFLKGNNPQLASLQAKMLGQLDSSDIEVTSGLYEALSKYYSIGQTGASKVLHIFIPKVFVMWDDFICKEYHHLHSGHKPQDIVCYREFVKTCNEVAKAIRTKISEEELSICHPSFEVSGFKKTLAKMIDECNYAQFTLPRLSSRHLTPPANANSLANSSSKR